MNQSLGGYSALEGSLLPLDIFGGLAPGKAEKNMGEIADYRHLLSPLEMLRFRYLEDL